MLPPLYFMIASRHMNIIFIFIYRAWTFIFKVSNLFREAAKISHQAMSQCL